jgi:antitoxin PrlF
MPTAPLTSKGQITLPKQIRERLGLTTDDRVAFHERPDGSVVLEPETVDLLSLRGCVRPQVRRVSIDDMRAAVKRTVARRNARTRR